MTDAPHVFMQPSADLASEWVTLGNDWAKWWHRATSLTDAAQSRDPPTSAPGTPDRFASIAGDYQAKLNALWQAVAATPPGQPLPEIVTLPTHDRRFKSAAWRSSPFHSFVLQAYLLHAGYLQDLASSTALPAPARKRLEFATRQWVDALSPSNFAATNPEVWERAIATDGGSLVAGMANLIADMRQGRISMSDPDAFEVGRNLAVTPGSVVFRNDLIEVLHYAPSTSRVHARPLVIVPPCINKYYILDLSPANSLVRHAVAQGHSTFMISWRNIPASLGHLTWDDYLEQGVLQAMRIARAVDRSRKVNVLGFCVGGTLLASALAVLAARGDASVASATFLTTMLDFEDPGDIGVYVSREFLAAREPALLSGQRLQGAELATAFASLRANDLVWNYVVNNYLKGDTPPAFDLLHWNGDSANLPGPMYAYYLRELYLDNRLVEPGALTMLGERIDLAKIDVPAYVVATRDDHIVPWRAAYRTTGLLRGDVSFVLGASGHIAGIVNPVESGRRSHRVNPVIADDPDTWLAGAEAHAGSWWSHWSEWIKPYAGARRKVAVASVARNPAFPALEPAPGRYVKERVP